MLVIGRRVSRSPAADEPSRQHSDCHECEVEARAGVRSYFGYGRGVTFYTWTSDQFSQYGAKVIPATSRDATYVLDEILDNETELELMLEEAEYRNLPAVSEEPVGARAQQALLEEAFADPEPVDATSPIERSEFQSARDSAAGWSSRNSPSASFWERVVKDVSIFTIVFAVLVFAILQTM